jgi:hypothetical protein
MKTVAYKSAPTVIRKAGSRSLNAAHVRPWPPLATLIRRAAMPPMPTRPMEFKSMIAIPA